MKNENQEQVKNIASIDNQYTKEQIQKIQKQKKRLIYRRRRLTLVFLVSVVVFLFIGVSLFRDYQTLQSLKSEKNEKVKEESQVQTDVEQLKATVKLLQDKEYVAKLARSRFYYTKEGELVFSYPELTTDSSGSTSK